MARPTNYTLKEHTYLWRADGNSATQGTGSIVNYPTLTSGTMTATLSQVPTSQVPTLPTVDGRVPGSGSFIKVVASGGASGGNVDVSMNISASSIANIGNFGLWFYDPVGGTSDITGSSLYLVNNSGFSKFFIFTSTGNGAGHRTKGWNLFTWQRGDQSTTGGGFTYDQTVARLMLRISLGVNKSATFYLGDVMQGYYTKPQIMIWAADNGAGAYDTMFPYMQARNMVGSYMPTSRYLAAPNVNQITVAELQEMQTAGWSIVPHQSIGAALTSMTEPQIRAEFDEILTTNARYGFTYRDFLYPAGGAGNALSNAVMASYGIKYGNNANTGNLKVGRPLYGGTINPYSQWSYTCDAKVFSTDIKVAIDHAIKYGGALGLLWHDGDGSDEVHFKDSINYLYRLREGGVIDVVNYETFFNRFKDPLGFVR
jgi:hypothetical protein